MYGDTVAECFLNLLKNEKYCDVVFEVGEAKEKIFCHQLCLKLRSPVFVVMFSERWKERNMKEIQVSDIEPYIFRLFLQFVYGGVFTTKISEAIKLLYVANKYQVISLVRRCEMLMETEVSLDDAIEVYQAAVQYNLFELKQRAGDLMAKEFSNLIKDTNVFQRIDEDTLIDLLLRDDLLVDELQLFHALLRWSIAQLETENPINSVDLRNILENILPFVRFPLMNAREFAALVVPLNILKPEECAAIFSYMESAPFERYTDALKSKLGFNFKPRELNASN